MSETERSHAPEWAYVALGSNLGDRHAALGLARARLGELPSTEVVAASAVQETDPLGPADQAAYLNQMVLLRTRLTPHELLHRCQQIEQDAGRERAREQRWGPRTLDLDIVRFGERVVDAPDLQIPHPELANRPFWRDGLAALAPHVSDGWPET